MLTLSAMLILAALGCGSSGTHPVVARASEIPAYSVRYTPPQSMTLGEPLRLLEERVLWLGVIITVLPEEVVEKEQAYGMAGTVEGRKTIYLPNSLSIDARFLILAHEAAHLFAPDALDQAQNEVFAEIVAYEVAQAFGVDILESAASYCAFWKAGLPAVPMLMSDIEVVTNLLVGDLSWK